MAQTGYTPILIYSSSTTSNVPAAGGLTNNSLGSELAINITDGKLFYKDNANAVQVIGWKTTPTTAGGTGLTSYAAGDLLYYASGTTLSKLAIGTNGQILKSTGSAPAWENVSALAVTSISFGTTGLTPSSATQGAVAVAGTLVAANGGTGQSSYTIGDILYASGTTTLSKLADVATGNALISGGVGVAPSWGKIGLTTHVSGTLPIANGGTGLTSLTANQVLYGSFSQSSNLFFDGTILGVGTSSPSGFATRLGILNGTCVNAANSTSYTAYFGVQNDLNYSGGMSLRPSNYSTYGAITANCLNFYYGSGNIVVSADGNNNVILAAGSGAPNRLQVHYGGGVSIGNTTDPGATNLSVTGTIQGGGKIFSQPGGYPISGLTGFGNNQGGYNDTTSKARVNLVGGVGDNGNRCGWTTYSIKTGGTGNGAEYYIRPVTWSGSAFAEQGSAGVYLQDNATSWSSASDERLKTDLMPIDDAANKVMTLRAVTGRYSADEEGTSRAFLIAQDVQQVLPQAVSENCEGYLGLAYTDMIPLLVAAIKELKQDLDAAKAEIQQLKV